MMHKQNIGFDDALSDELEELVDMFEAEVSSMKKGITVKRE